MRYFETIGSVLEEQLRLAVAPDGSAVAAGIEYDGGPTSAWARRFTPDTSSTSWGPAVTIVTDVGSVGLGIAADGAALAAARVNSALGMSYRRYSPGVGWSAASERIPFFADRFDERWLLTMGPGGAGLAVAVDENPPGVFSAVGDLFAVRFE